MKSIRRLIGRAVFCFLTACAASHGADVSEIFSNAKNSVVLIIAQDVNQTPLAIGSGFFFRKRLIASNYHVVRGATSFKLKVVGNNSIITNARVRSYTESLDLAVIETAEDGIPLPLADGRSVEIGQKVVAIGNPRGLTGTVSEGIVSGVRDLGGLHIYQITAPISPGSSGGPVLLSSGEVLGIATFTLNDSQNLNFAMPASLLNELAEKTMKWEPPKSPGLLYRKGNAGVELVLFKKAGADFTESFSIKNTTRNSIKNVCLLLLYKTAGGELFHFRLTDVPDVIPPGFAKMVTERSFDQNQRFSYRGERGAVESLYERFDVEMRVLSYDIVQQESAIADKLLNPTP